MEERRWPDLPADVLREISSRFCAATDFVYFHAVCHPWRASRDPMSPTTTSTQFLPWLLAPADKDTTTDLRFRCIFSKSSYHGTKPALQPAAVAGRNWVSSADGTKVRYLTVEDLRPTLHDPITGEFTHLPLFPEDVSSHWEAEENPSGVIYGDGTTLLYSIWYLGDDVHTARFMAALLRPGSDMWTVVKRTLQVPRSREFCVAYHGGKIMLASEATLWRVIIASDGGDDDDDDDDDAGDDDLLVTMPPPLPWWEQQSYFRQYSYILESRGELLWVSVKVNSYMDWHGKEKLHEFSVTVHMLEIESSSPQQGVKMRWVKKDGCTMADRVLFLGTPCSFAVDASSRLGGLDGGCVYFVYHYIRALLPCPKVGLFSYNLLSRKSNFFERLPHGWSDERCTWHVPQPTIAPIQELIKVRQLKKQRRQQTELLTSPTLRIHIRRHYEPSYKLKVGNLPLTMKSSQLQLLLSRHGQVSSAQVIFYKKTKRSQGIALVTMSTLHANPQDALDALNALSFEGYDLQVTFTKEERQRYQQPPSC